MEEWRTCQDWGCIEIAPVSLGLALSTSLGAAVAQPYKDWQRRNLYIRKRRES